MTTSAKSNKSVKVWDLPTRLFHWTLVLLVILAIVSRNFGDPLLVWHMANGYSILVLLVFRLLWGFFGSTTARFGEFLTGPGAVLAYLQGVIKGEHRHFVGHNPAGGWSVISLLAILTVQGVTGLFASDDILVRGPLAFLFSERVVALLSSIHRLCFLVLIPLIALHIGAVVFYLKQGDNLILPMITGEKESSQLPSGPVEMNMRNNRLALALLVIAGLVVWLGISLWKWY